MSYFADFGGCRLCVTDTDSLQQSVERERSIVEQNEIKLLTMANKQVPYFETLHAERYTESFVKTFANFLDWSSINEVQFHVPRH